MGALTVTFDPHRRTVKVDPGTDLMSAAIKAGIVLNAACGGEGLCGKCRVIITKGGYRAEPSRFISAEDRRKGVVLACQTIVDSDLEVTVPSASVEAHEKLSHESEEFTCGVPLEREKAFRFSPMVRKVYLELHGPTSEDSTGDLDRICDALRSEIDGVHVSTRLANVKHLGQVLRDGNFKITVTLAYRDDAFEILYFEPGDRRAANFAFAFDIGTTTVAAQLIELRSGEVLGTRIAFNRQAAHGQDVITRIIFASDPAGLAKLNEAVISNINEMVEELTAAHQIPLGDVCAVVFAGNMTMMHLLLKIDPSNIRKAPYVPVTSVFPTVYANEVGVEMNPKGIAAFLPGVSTYLGGDIVSGVLACGLADEPGISLLVDIGTNGEIVLGNNEWMIGAAASAGPAFEGSGLSCGMKAVQGAVQKVTIGRSLTVEYETIGGGRAKGICGSGYIDLLCQMLRAGIVAKDGRIDPDRKNARVRMRDNVREFVVVPSTESATGSDIVITDDDIENLKRAKGAIYSAIISLVNKVGKTIADIERIYIAGGFGSYLNIENSIFIGLLPDTRRDAYRFIGNSSLAGARMSLVSHEAFERAIKIHKGITYLDLGSEPAYMDEYIAALFFPHTDTGRFPSVRL